MKTNVVGFDVFSWISLDRGYKEEKKEKEKTLLIYHSITIN